MTGSNVTWSCLDLGSTVRDEALRPPVLELEIASRETPPAPMTYNWTDWTERAEAGAMSWQLQEAKQRFSELVRRTLEEGPQIVTRHGKEVVVVVPAEEFRRLRGDKPDFKEFLMSAPDLSALDLERPKEMPRDVEL